MTHSNRLPPFKYKIAECVICGAPWRRPLAKSWATRCPTCYRWSRIDRGIRLAATAMREGRTDA